MRHTTFIYRTFYRSILYEIKKLCAGLFALGMAFSLMLPTPVRAAEAASGITTNAVPGWPQGADITSTAAVVMEESTNTIVYAKNMDQQLFPGSTVKIMTTLLALENSQLTDQVTMTATGVSGVTDGGANISANLDEVFYHGAVSVRYYAGICQ